MDFVPVRDLVYFMRHTSSEVCEMNGISPAKTCVAAHDVPITSCGPFCRCGAGSQGSYTRPHLGQAAKRDSSDGAMFVSARSMRHTAAHERLIVDMM